VKVLDNRYYDNVIAEMQTFFDENKFRATDDGSFISDTIHPPADCRMDYRQIQSGFEK